MSDITHEAKVVDWCYGMTGGIKVRCSCGDYWVLNRNADEGVINLSILDHKRAASKKPTETL